MDTSIRQETIRRFHSCPECGADNLAGDTILDFRRFNSWVAVRCGKCGYVGPGAMSEYQAQKLWFNSAWDLTHVC